MKTLMPLAITLLLSFMFLVPILPGCEQEGPAEQAGEAVDEATENVGKKLEEAGESVQDAAN